MFRTSARHQCEPDWYPSNSSVPPSSRHCLHLAPAPIRSAQQAAAAGKHLSGSPLRGWCMYVVACVNVSIHLPARAVWCKCQDDVMCQLNPPGGQKSKVAYTKSPSSTAGPTGSSTTIGEPSRVFARLTLPHALRAHVISDSGTVWLLLFVTVTAAPFEAAAGHDSVKTSPALPPPSLHASWHDDDSKRSTTVMRARLMQAWS